MGSTRASSRMARRGVGRRTRWRGRRRIEACVYFRALSELFHGKPADVELTVKLSMLEIYNETLIDLLTDKRM